MFVRCKPWKTTVPFLTFHFCPKSLKKSFSTTSLPSPRKQSQQSLAVSLLNRTQHWDRFVTYCKWYSLHSGQWQHFCSSFVDLSAAFDTIDHQILLSHLDSVFGIQSTALQWFQSYFSDRYQSTSVNNSSSSPSQLMYGVPQGSVLGPILFVLYTTPLSDIIANHSVNHQLFADDTQLQKSSPLSEVTNLTKELNACTDHIKT